MTHEKRVTFLNENVAPLTQTQAKILVAMGFWQIMISDIARKTGISRTSIYDQLLNLEFKGYVHEGEAGWQSILVPEETDKLKQWLEATNGRETNNSMDQKNAEGNLNLAT